jgi:hypothetical protein
MVTYSYHLYEKGKSEYGTWFKVASVYAPTEEEARREIEHYAMMYGQDGPVKIRKGRLGK